MRLVNGEFVIDEESLRVDRHERDALQSEDMEIVEEDNNTRLVNSSTFMKRERTERWETEEVNMFYQGLSMFGTDFTMLAGLFPHRTRRQIKNKFNVEERKDPLRVTMALRKRIPVGELPFPRRPCTNLRWRTKSTNENIDRHTRILNPNPHLLSLAARPRQRAAGPP